MTEELNKNIITGQSLSSPPYFDGTNYTYWKEKMEIFIQSLDFKLWLVIKNGPNIPKKVVEGEEVEKSEDEFDDEDIKKMEQNAKAKYIFHCAINPEDFKKISSCETAKQMWDELDRTTADPVLNSTTQPQLVRVTSGDYHWPSGDFLQDTREAMDAFFKFCVPLHKYAQEGNWSAAKRILDQDTRLRNAAIAEGWPTVLHVAAGAKHFAAGANHVHFMEELLKLMDDSDLALKDYKGNTAFCFAAAGGNWKIANLMLQKREDLPRIRGGEENTPVQFAALQGRSKMARHLYPLTKGIFEVRDWDRLFFTCINTGMYDLALDMVKERRELAFARDGNQETRLGPTGLHLLAQKPLDSCCQCPEPETPIMINPGMKQNVALQLVNFLWNTILCQGISKSEIRGIIDEHYPLLFDAAEVGNFGFLSELISAYPKLIWESDSRNRSIIHIAVLHRHASIYNVIHEIGNQKDIILTYEDDDDNTLLHLAAMLAPAVQLELVSGAAFQMSLELLWFEELLRLMDEDGSDLAMQDYKGNTAFCSAAAAGNLQIVDSMLQRNRFLPTIRGGGGATPIQFAALQGRCEMARHLYPLTKEAFEVKDWNLLFFTCIKTGIYDLALDMVTEREELAFARDENEETGLHLLAQKPLDSCCQCPERQTPIMINPGKKQHVVLQLVSFLWNTILRKKDSKLEIISIIREPSPLLFVAAEVGNFGFLSELISAYPNLIWEVDSRNRSIIHIAVLHRHASIYNLIHEIGNQKDIIVTFVDSDDGNTLLHLAAKLAPAGQLELISGAAFQMSLELLWFEEVKKIMPPSFINMKNSDNVTARELFTAEHAQLLKKAEAWMKRTAESCMLISTVIATGVLSAAINSPGGINDDTGIPNYLKKPSFVVFEISGATAFISSATSILMFLSILISRYAEYDFYKSLPLKLICGLITLFISITSMMIAFGCAFFITFYHGLKWIPSFISILSCLPILLFIFLQFSLWSDIIKSTYYCRNIFKPGENMLKVLEK